ncbi:hypothetical protein [Actinoplanes sp. G11-F43]|uniref:hypothetical protein n=1 Tax=Actinoplanes sp. G11-F43 TaxID=3424130 RepID=UPI003D32AAE0
MTPIDPRAAALADLREWTEHQATARQRLIAAAWRAGVHNVAELARAAGVRRDTVYADLRRENIDPTERSTMPTTTLPSRRAQVRDRLIPILAELPLRGPREESPDPAAVLRQAGRVTILKLLYGLEEVAEVYTSWLDTSLAEQDATATGLATWSEAGMPTAPLPRWTRDRHGFLCVGCGENFWTLVSRGDVSSRWCKTCARDLAELRSEQVWIPRRSPLHHDIAFPGVLPDERYDNLLPVNWNGSIDITEYVMGEADAFLAGYGWMGLATSDEPSPLTGDLEAPTLKAAGQTTKPGHRFAWTASFAYDRGPNGWRKTPYGFRLVTGTLTSDHGVSTFDDAFTMLDTIAAGNNAQ